MQNEGLISGLSHVRRCGRGPLSILRHLPRIMRRVYSTVDRTIAAEPDVVVIIDSPEFTHSIAKRIRKRRPDIPIVDYVSPSVWAWRPGRSKKMRPYVDHILGLLAVRARGARAPWRAAVRRYVGHPLDRASRVGYNNTRSGAASCAPRPRSQPARARRAAGQPDVGGRPAAMEPFGDTLRLLIQSGPAPEVIVPCVAHVRGTDRASGQRLAAAPASRRWARRTSSALSSLRMRRLRPRAPLRSSSRSRARRIVVAYRVDPVAARFCAGSSRRRRPCSRALCYGAQCLPRVSSGKELARKSRALRSSRFSRIRRSGEAQISGAGAHSGLHAYPRGPVAERSRRRHRHRVRAQTQNAPAVGELDALS